MSKIKLLVVLLLYIILLPFMVNAEECNQNSIKIQSISVKDKSEYVEELNDATFDTNKINLDLKMYDVGDYIEYELKVKNESNEDYYLNKDSLNINMDYFEYSISFNDNSNKIEPNTEKTIYLRVEYKNEVEKDKFFSGKYTSNNTVTLKSINNNSDNNSITNPLTKNNKVILIIGLLILLSVLYFTKNKRINKTMILLLGIILPFEVAALCNFELDINSNITIGKVKPNPCTYDGELVQGAEYVNGQLTYRYGQEIEGYYADNTYGWKNKDNDGWAVILTDLNSTDDVNTKICSTINGKPVNIANHMFCNSQAKHINVSDWDVSNIEDMAGMFKNISNVESLDLSNWDTSNLKKMNSMFNETKSLKKIDLSSFDTSNVNDMEFLFSGNESLEEINVSNFNLSKVTSLRYMFYINSSLKKITFDNWDTSNIINMEGMFYFDEALESLDLSNFDTSKVENMKFMFTYATSLKKIFVSDKFKINNVTDSADMFNNVRLLVGGNGTVFDSYHIDKEYARIDEPGKPGYFTRK